MGREKDEDEDEDEKRRTLQELHTESVFFRDRDLQYAIDLR